MHTKECWKCSRKCHGQLFQQQEQEEEEEEEEEKTAIKKKEENGIIEVFEKDRSGKEGEDLLLKPPYNTDFDQGKVSFTFSLQESCQVLSRMTLTKAR